MSKIEIACFNIEAARIAQQHGADRVEFCADMQVGGTTPDLQKTEIVRRELHIALHVMIRPRGGNFVYSVEEFAQMKNEILTYSALGADGFVFGILDEAGNIDKQKNKALVELAGGKSCTFHRAFDEVSDSAQALEDIIACDFTTVLTSGCAPNVDLGQEELKRLVEQARDRIAVMPGGGLRSTNIRRIWQETGADYFHSSAITDGSETAVAIEVDALVQAVKLY
ncbi:copper homeostasis protein CutC [Sphingobacterium chuzhouense]|uniref:PF03932 family protein CutC n=1 Tax=Sphingobacterium chuzhouense TaxID=1742264 RepID=A0ABR7XQK0_9SPHI|nr:copper homeostasis protein CutC [Sphingobacterium chuzhouense]MBD1421413.1 copper homeostasis protein CutC [Sphingobacterium chuzhouense]